MDAEPQLPIRISVIASKYFIFDIDVVTYLRRVHHICGINTGTLHQSPSQNVFLGLPVEIMPEEAQLLLDKAVAFIDDDAEAHRHAMRQAGSADHAAYQHRLHQKAEQISRSRSEVKAEQKRQSLNKKAKSVQQRAARNGTDQQLNSSQAIDGDLEAASSELLFDSNIPAQPSHLKGQTSIALCGITPSTSDLFLPLASTAQMSNSTQVTRLPASYPLYKHLHSKSYFMTPGLRFGCQYCVYPGDPLRYHSHFLAVGMGWEEEVDLMDIVGGGRLGTGVKKGFLIGAPQPSLEEPQGTDSGDNVRVFSIEWAVM